MLKKTYNELENRILNLERMLDTHLNGGKGSGNFGHKGRPGEVGGSAPDGASGGSDSDEKYKIKPGGNEGVDGLKASDELELREIADKYGKYNDGREAYFYTFLSPEPGQSVEEARWKANEAISTRKNDKKVKTVIDIAKKIQTMAKKIVKDEKLSDEQKAALIDASVAVYGRLRHVLLSNDTFDANGLLSRTWSLLDGSDETKTFYAKELRNMGDTIYEIAKSRGGKPHDYRGRKTKNDK